MTTLSFGTLKLARRLETAGFSTKQAGDTAEALAESLRGTSDLATRQDLELLRSDLAEVKADLRSELYRALGLQAAGIVGVLSAVGALLKVQS